MAFAASRAQAGRDAASRRRRPRPASAGGGLGRRPSAGGTGAGAGAARGDRRPARPAESCSDTFGGSFWTGLQRAVGRDPTGHMTGLRVDGIAGNGAGAPERRLAVTIVGATGLPPGDAEAGADDERYCVCEVPGKPGARCSTHAGPAVAEPAWDHFAELEGVQEGDELTFTVWDSVHMLGTATLSASKVASGFKGAIPISDMPEDLGAGDSPALSVKVTFIPVSPRGRSSQQQSQRQTQRPSSAPAGGRRGSGAGALDGGRSQQQPWNSSSKAADAAAPRPTPQAALERLRARLEQLHKERPESPNRKPKQSPEELAFALQQAEETMQKAVTRLADPSKYTGTARHGGPRASETGMLNQVLLSGLRLLPPQEVRTFSVASGKKEGTPLDGKFLRKGDFGDRPYFERKTEDGDIFIYCYRRQHWCIAQSLGAPPSEALATSSLGQSMYPPTTVTDYKKDPPEEKSAWKVNPAHAAGEVIIHAEAQLRLVHNDRLSLTSGSTGLWTHPKKQKEVKLPTPEPMKRFGVHDPSAAPKGYEKVTEAARSWRGEGDSADFGSKSLPPRPHPSTVGPQDRLFYESTGNHRKARRDSYGDGRHGKGGNLGSATFTVASGGSQWLRQLEASGVFFGQGADFNSFSPPLTSRSGHALDRTAPPTQSGQEMSQIKSQILDALEQSLLAGELDAKVQEATSRTRSDASPSEARAELARVLERSATNGDLAARLAEATASCGGGELSPGQVREELAEILQSCVFMGDDVNDSDRFAGIMPLRASDARARSVRLAF